MYCSLSNKSKTPSKKKKSMEAGRGEEAAEEKFEANRAWFMRFEERNQLCNTRVGGEAAGTMEKLQQVTRSIQLRSPMKVATLHGVFT